MSTEDRFRDDEQALSRLGSALGYDPEREPPPERVAAVRAAAERMREQQRRSEPPATATVRALPSRRGLLLSGAAASIGVLAGFGVRPLIDRDATEGPPTEAIGFATALAGVRSDARLINHTWGTELLLDIAGLPPGQTYRIRYDGANSGGADAGSFLSVADTVMQCRFNAAVLRADVTSIAVVDDTDSDVLRAELA